MSEHENLGSTLIQINDNSFFSRQLSRTLFILIRRSISLEFNRLLATLGELWRPALAFG